MMGRKDGSAEEKIDHPTQKPVKLMLRPIKQSHRRVAMRSGSRSTAAAPRWRRAN